MVKNKVTMVMMKARTVSLNRKRDIGSPYFHSGHAMCDGFLCLYVCVYLWIFLHYTCKVSAKNEKKIWRYGQKGSFLDQNKVCAEWQAPLRAFRTSQTFFDNLTPPLPMLPFLPLCMF